MKKRLLALLLAAVLLTGAAGCAREEDMKTPVNFYYPRQEYTYGQNGSVLKAELHDAGDDLENLNYLITVYLRGPKTEACRSPFPWGLRLLSCRRENGTLYLKMSDALGGLSGLDLALACASLSMTCLELTGADRVNIRAETVLLDGRKSITLDHDQIALFDGAFYGPSPETQP